MTTTEEKEQMELERQLQESGLEGRATWQLSFATGDQRCMQSYLPYLHFRLRNLNGT